ncbi:DUF2934 domain-containing protein [Rhizobium sp. TRM95111]|uniref:DUF2934 domain-containing protein n=1 Tax=Rhizobium alarense TaxID=2846851 RepID=UPI001F197315|nr:DUF2934 domain-containing protein [Rhizobium alarense]MCF3642098.1 DUF2934 domain-containing protein [Rhizobium alarense]
MNDVRMEWISKRAYSLWERDGRPCGRDREHWEQATRERDEFERVALPRGKKGKGDKEADALTQVAIAGSKKLRTALSEASGAQAGKPAKAIKEKIAAPH